jgi:4-amino-4-deoxy-L-arabinose transferase-like glycosyltransferase
MLKKSLPLLLILIIGAALRLYQLGAVPPGLFGDEVDAGYNAYSILKTGRDYNGNPWPIHFESYGDYRTPLYLYAIVPFLPLFGLTAFAVRFPAALFGILGIFSTYLLTKELYFSPKANKTSPNESLLSNVNYRKLGVIASLLLAITPWHIHYSRAAFEVTLMYFLLTLGTYFLLKAINHLPHKNNQLTAYHLPLITSTVLFGLSIYSYNTAKLFTLMLIIGLIIIFRKPLFQIPKKYLLLALCSLLLVSAPMIYDSTFGAGQNRFSNINLTHDPTIVPEINRQRGQHPNPNSFIVKLQHNRPLAWSQLFIKNYLTSFSPQFLLFSQTDNARHVVENSPQIFYWMLPFLLLGIYTGINRIRQPGYQLTFFWLLTAPLPATLTLNGGNHPTRLFTLIFPLAFFTAIGLNQTRIVILNLLQNLRISNSHQRLLSYTLICLLLSTFAFELTTYLDNYYTHYPLDSYQAWQVGFPQAITYTQNHQDQYQQIIITKSYGPPLLHFLFHSQFPPDKFQQIQATIGKQGNLSPTPERIGKFWFTSIAPGDVTQPPNTLYLAAPWDNSQGWHQLDTINLPDGTELFKILSSD